MTTIPDTMTNGDLRRAAVMECAEALADGEQLAGPQIAERWNRSDGWARAVIREARQLLLLQEAAEAATNGNRNAVDTGLDQPPVLSEPDAAAAADPAVTTDVPQWVGPVTTLAVVVVALAAAFTSVEHLADLARLAGAEGWRAWLLPASVDGLAVAAAMALYRAHVNGQGAGIVPWTALIAGIVASVAGNVLSVYPELVQVGTLKVAVGATPPLALALAIELGLRRRSRQRRERTSSAGRRANRLRD